VIGVDTHRDQHTLAVVAASTGAVIARSAVATDRRGYEAALRVAAGDAVGVRVWAVEGAGHYGAGLTRFLAGRGEAIAEVGRGARMERRLRGKDDPLDAVRVARSALASDTITLPRAGERQEALRLLLLARLDHARMRLRWSRPVPFRSVKRPSSDRVTRQRSRSGSSTSIR
jgi:transposase